MKSVGCKVDRPRWKRQILPTAKVSTLQMTPKRNGQILSNEIVKLSNGTIFGNGRLRRSECLLIAFQPEIFDYFRKIKRNLDRGAISTNVLRSIESSGVFYIIRNARSGPPVTNCVRSKSKESDFSRRGNNVRPPSEEIVRNAIVIRKGLNHNLIRLTYSAGGSVRL